MNGWSTAYVAAALIVAVAGVQKLRDPLPAHRALRIARWPSRPDAVRALAGAELVTGAAAIAGWRPAALALSLLYGAFAAFVLQALARRLPISSCGCFGAADSPPRPAHVAINAAAAAVSLLQLVDPTDTIAASFDDSVSAGIATALAAVALAAAGIMILRGRGNR